MDKIYDVLCIGLIVTDLLVQPVDKSIFDIETTRIEEIKALPGGDAMNEAIILARLGQKVGLVGKIGDDSMGHLVLQQAKDNRVDISNVKIDSNTKTSTSIVLINKNGERNFVYCAGNNESFSLEDIDLSIISKAKIVNIGSLCGLPSLDKTGVEEIFKLAKANDVTTAADTTFDICNLGFSGIKDVLKYLDFFMPSYSEAKYLTNQTEPGKMADFLLKWGVKTVVLKLGHEGCFIKNAEETYLLPAYEVNAIDTTGGGDNFVAGFLTGLSNGWNLKACGMFANAVGAISTQMVGANAAVKSMDQVFAFMNKSRL